MLICGIFWAYIIGSLVEAVGSMGSVTRDYVERMDRANQMLSDFAVKDMPQSITGATTGMKVSKRVRRFITNQRDKTTKKWLDDHSCLTLTETYPTLSVLSPELQRVCALHLVQPHIEKISYLSSKYLSPEEQAEIALKSVTLEFSSGEKFYAHPELGRGIVIVKQGFGFTTRNEATGNFRWRKGLPNTPVDANEVLVEDEYCREKQLVYHFVGFAKVLFIPRSVIMDVLSKNEQAWKRSARWGYFQASYILHSKQNHSAKAELV